MLFCDTLQRYANFLFAYFGHILLHTQNDSCINLWKTSMFICMPKINLINYFFLEVLNFKESCNLIGWQSFGP